MNQKPKEFNHKEGILEIFRLMLQEDPIKRPDFIDLKEQISKIKDSMKHRPNDEIDFYQKYQKSREKL